RHSGVLVLSGDPGSPTGRPFPPAAAAPPGRIHPERVRIIAAGCGGQGGRQPGRAAATGAVLQCGPQSCTGIHMASYLITGANRGIGLSLTQQLCARGDDVVAVCRQASPALSATGAQVIDGVDVSDARAVAALPERLGEGRIDGLILNAGIFTNERLDALDADAFARIQRQFEVNTLGPLRVVAALQ